MDLPPPLTLKSFKKHDVSVVFGSRERRNNNLQACASILISDNNYRIDDVTSICVFPGGDLWWANTKLIINSGAIYNPTVD